MLRSALRAGALTAAALGLCTAAALPAAAAQSDGFTGLKQSTSVSASAGPISIQAATWDIYYNGSYRGYVQWQQDPSGSIPGDSLRVCDDIADGYGVEADLIVGGVINRTATSQGHSSPYCSPWKSGNLTEGNSYTIDTWVMSNNVYSYIGSVSVTA
ncbi:hypothetical protein SRB5_13490 [Streptomyces sp. RB5]|uniref:Secreted protein n=1 Tax=Streptomyces smaragdinus TaxID=2585196 RepID=A0A7K0CEP0_9ACTN|nr:hypothetical protein [Streptomyces smaragdinus]MQY11234.1 hypothetical protein [Streptomyces smaragdinus]